MFGLIALMAKLSHTCDSLRGLARVIDVVFVPLLSVTERWFGQSPLAAVGLLVFLCLAVGLAIAWAIQWMARR